jgi:homoprotocatechuate degradation regulator HpaR
MAKCMSPSTNLNFRHRNLPLLLLRAREGVVSQFKPLLNAHGVTEQQWRILRVLVDEGPMEPRQIARACGISGPSLAGILARMDALGLVRRRRFASDARRVGITLTPASRALARKVAPKIESIYLSIEASIGAELITSAYGILDTLIARLGSTAGPLAP